MRRAIGLATMFLCLACLTVTVPAADVEDLITKLKDKDSDVRRSAAQDLIKAGPAAKDAAPALVVALKDPDAFVRRYSAQALGVIGADPAIVAAPLTALLRDGKERKETQMAAAISLSKLGAAAAVPLASAVRDPGLDTAVRHKIIRALGALGAKARPTMSTLMDEFMGKNMPKGRAELSQEEKREEKIALIEVLEKIVKAEDKAVITALADAAINKNLPKGRGNLDQQEKVAVLSLLESVVTAEDKTVVTSFADALAGRNLPKGVNPLSPGERMGLLGVLTKAATAEDKAVLSALETVLNEDKLKDDEQLKKAAKEAQTKIMEKK